MSKDDQACDATKAAPSYVCANSVTASKTVSCRRGADEEKKRRRNVGQKRSYCTVSIHG